MPNGNKKGPEGNGPLTGKKMGFCVGNNHPGNEGLNRAYGRRRFGNHEFRGRGNRNGFDRAYRNGNKNFSINTDADFQNQLSEIKQKLNDLADKINNVSN